MYPSDKMPPKGTRSTTKFKATELDRVAASPAANVSEGVVTPTPTTRRSKRKAAPVQQDADADAEMDAKKPKVAVHTTELDILSASGKPTQHQVHRNVQIEIPLASATKPAAAGKKTFFNDEDSLMSPDGPSEFFTPQGSPTTAAPASAQQPSKDEEQDDGGSESDSDNDAPEAVSTHTAAAQAAKSAQAAAHAVEKQREAERQKRQARDARLKAQAGSRKKKQPSKQQAQESDSEEDETKAPSSRPTKRFTKNNPPDMLPEELLASDSESDDQEETLEKRRPTIIKFNTVARQVAKAESRQPADQRVGSTVYRVMKKSSDDRLAPKGGKYSRHARKELLERGRAPATRKTAAKGGFLVKR